MADQNLRVRIGLDVGVGGTIITTTPAGLVGIGTTNPQYKFDVGGDLRLRGGLYDSNNQVGIAGSVLISTGAGVSWTSGGTGTQGSQGIQGTSVQGIQGITGTGTQGSQGIQGTSVQGIQGITGTGTQGSQGIQGTSVQGIQGITGTTGNLGGVPYTFSTIITDSDPGNGVIQYNSGTIGSVTTIFIDNNDSNSNVQTTWYDTWNDSTNPNQEGYLIIQGSAPGSTTVNVFNVTAVAAAVGYYKITVTHISGSLPTNSATLSVQFSRTGDQGAQGIQGITGTATQGAQGITGTATQGAQGIQGTSVQGIQGITGTGTQGAQGITGTATQGIQGITGPSTAINATAVTSGTFYPVFVAAAGSNQTPSVRTTATAFSFDASTGNLVVGGTVTASSDKRVKNNIITIENALSKVCSLRGVEFDYKESGNHSLGFVAQEVEKVIPDLVFGTDSKTVAYQNFVALLVEAIKEQQKIIEKQQKQIDVVLKNLSL